MALMLTFILTGLGQIYAGRVRRGILFFSIHLIYGISLLLYFLNPNTKINIFLLILVIPLLAFGIFILIDSYRCAKLYNLNHNLKRNITAGKRILFIAGILFFTFVFSPFNTIVAYYIRNNVVQAFKIPSATMQPTLIEGDRILVDKTIYRKSEPKRGDLVIFIYPEDPKRIFVKRLVGLPGETIEIKNGRLLINGDVIHKYETLAKIHYYNKGDYGKEGEAVGVPDDSYYVLGDNSAYSLDSRYWGFVHRKYLLGKAYKIYFPFDRSGAVK